MFRQTRGGTEVEIEIFALCDAATDYSGKLNLLGTFDFIWAKQFPATHPHCSVALRVRFERIEEGDHRVRISIVDEDGKPIGPSVDGGIGVKFPPNLPSICANMVLNITGMKFEKPGWYSIDLAIDNRHEKSLPLTVSLVEPKPQPQG
jgi:hypothetical protein